jgi:hypothetical protein
VLAEPEKPIGAALMDEYGEVIAVLVLPKPSGIIVLGSNGNWLATAAAVEGESVLEVPVAEVSASSLAVVAATFDVVPEVVEDAERPSLMLMS